MPGCNQRLYCEHERQCGDGMCGKVNSTVEIIGNRQITFTEISFRESDQSTLPCQRKADASQALKHRRDPLPATNAHRHQRVTATDTL